METLKILIIDDDDVDREKICRLLKSSSFEIASTEASSGKQALELMREQSFDCIVLDYRLGDGLGTDLLTTMRIEFGLAAPVIMVTGLGDEQIAVEALQEGVYDYIVKSQLQSQRLTNSIERCLRRRELELSLMRTQDRLTRLSMYDSLTNLPNRNLFFDRFDQAILATARGGLAFSLLMLDLDLFKEVNDTLGHAAGDQLLILVAQRLSSICRENDTVARLGGDEFAILLMGADSPQLACLVAEKINVAMREPFSLEGQVVRIDASIGVACFPQHGSETHSLMRNADTAMYAAKRNGQGHEVFCERLYDLHDSPMLLSNRIIEAINKDQIFLDYQPIINLKNGDIKRVEALARWLDPGVGMIPPLQFIAAAERSSVINPLTYFLLDKVCDQAKVWYEQRKNIPIALNVSARMLADSSLEHKILDALEKRNLPPHVLSLEITETALLSHSDAVRENLDHLSKHRIGISIDDFGSGYTSFKYLREMDICEIKIDQLYVQALHASGREESIIRSICTLGEGFNIDVVAEGIESAEDCALLRDLGCSCGQGFAISHPLSPSSLMTWRENWQPNALAAEYALI